MFAEPFWVYVMNPTDKTNNWKSPDEPIVWESIDYLLWFQSDFEWSLTSCLHMPVELGAMLSY